MFCSIMVLMIRMNISGISVWVLVSFSVLSCSVNSVEIVVVMMLCGVI